jgi:hypothetical protein
MPSSLVAVPSVRLDRVASAARGRSVLWRAGPVLLAVVLAGVYLVWQPMSADLAAAEYRAWVFGRDGLAVWDLRWYSGHHLPGYSVTVPPLSWLIGPRLLGALAAVGATVLFERLAWTAYGARAWVGVTWFAAGSVTSLLSGRITFAVGLVPALAALVVLQRRRADGVAVGLGVVTALTSPVAALFLAVAGTAVAVGQPARRMVGLALATAALLPVLALSVAFPEGGTEPFSVTSCVTTLLYVAVVLMLLPRGARTLRVGVTVYALGCIAACVVPTPVGSNVVRLGALCAGPVLAVAMTRERRSRLVVLALVAPFLLWWQWQAAVADVRTASGDRSTQVGYYQPLLDQLRREAGPAGARLEIPFTRLHWEARWGAPRVPLARGWERQVDIADNSVFYDGALTAARYRGWLDANAVAWVALPRTRLDYSAEQEARLIPRLTYLREAWHNADWTLYAVRDPAPLAEGAARVTAASDRGFTLEATRRGDVRVRVRWTPYWAITTGDACVMPDGDWTRIGVRHAGMIRLEPRFSVGRIGDRSPRCHD